jgi:hypothetical protein
MKAGERRVLDAGSPLDRVETKLTRLGASFERTASSITIHPANEHGFEVGFAMADDRFRVWFEGWHEPFTDADEALRAVAWGLSAECRLKVTYRGNIAVAWTTQHCMEGVWHDDATTGWLLTPFWRPKRHVFKQNHLATEATANA